MPGLLFLLDKPCRCTARMADVQFMSESNEGKWRRNIKSQHM